MNNTTLKGLILSLYKSINWHHKKQWTELSYWIFFAGEGGPKKIFFLLAEAQKLFQKVRGFLSGSSGALLRKDE